LYAKDAIRWEDWFGVVRYWELRGYTKSFRLGSIWAVLRVARWWMVEALK